MYVYLAQADERCVLGLFSPVIRTQQRLSKES